MKRNNLLATTGLSLGLVMALQSGCAQNAVVTQPPAVKPEAVAQNVPQSAHTPAPQTGLVGLSGKVVEAIKAGSYTYLNLEKDGKQSWAAMSSSFPAEVGQELTLAPGTVMNNFQSKSLNRTFESIVFTDGPVGQVKVNPHDSAKGSAQQQPAEQAGTLVGKVLETMNAGGYTYINLATGGKSTWVAVPEVGVSVGQQVAVQAGMPMEKFTSKSLNRTFDRIVFSPGLASGAAGQGAESHGMKPSGHPGMGADPQQGGGEAAQTGQGAAGMGHGGTMKRGRENVELSGKVLESADAGGYTFVHLEQGGKKAWAAIPNMKVTPGQELKLEPGTEMVNFNSKKLNRSFDSVIFSSGVKSVK